MGAEMMQPMAIVTIGGLAYATLMTLFVVPALYDIFNGKKMKAREIEMMKEAAGMQREGFGEEEKLPAAKPELKAQQKESEKETKQEKDAEKAPSPEKTAPKKVESFHKRVHVKL